MFFQVFMLLMLMTAVDASCQFPARLQTNRTNGSPRDWVGHVRQQFTQVGLHVLVAGNIIRVTSSDPAAGPSYTVVCLQIISSDRYLVAYEQSHQRVARYSCLQFIRRSSDVIQLRAAAVSGRMDRAMCQDAALITDPWLMFDRSRLGRYQVPCPLHGGYSAHLFDKSRQTGVCDAYRGETRVESECERNDGFVFLFRQTHCIPADMYMYSRQSTRCVAGWTDHRSVRSYHFTLLRHHDPQHAYYWLLRVPLDAVDGNLTAFSSVLFKDLVADVSPIVNETRNYIRVDMQRDDDVVPLCADEYEMCWDSLMEVERRCREGRDDEQQTSWHSLALTCPRTCHLCDDSSPSSCGLPTSWRGSWVDAATGASVNINDTAVNIIRRAADDEDQDDVDGLTMGCVRWRTDAVIEDDLVMLVTVYGAGCRPRYRCVRVLRQSSSLLYLQLSDASSWPLVRSPLDPVDCRSFHFDRWTTTSPAVSASAGGVNTMSGYLLSLVVTDGPSVDCRLPSEVVGVQYNAEFVIDGSRPSDRCSATLTQSGGTLQLTLTGCSSSVVRQFTETNYKCIDSSPVGDSDDVVIITTSSRRSTLFCWLFTHNIYRRRSRPSSSLSYYLLTGDECHTAVVPAATSSFSPSRQLIYTAFFTRRRPVSTVQTTSSQSQGESVTLTTVSTSVNPHPPRPRNVTMTDSDQDGQSGGFKDAFVFAVVTVMMAVIELMLLCRC